MRFSVKVLITFGFGVINFSVNAGTFGDIARDADGNILLLSHAEAAKYCSLRGARLPTAREYAELAQSLGAKIRETSYPDMNLSPLIDEERAQNGRDGYYAIYHHNSSGSAGIYFYFKYSGYVAPSSDEGRNWFWSSTSSPGTKADGSEDFYFYSGSAGSLHDYDSGDLACAVRCVTAR